VLAQLGNDATARFDGQSLFETPADPARAIYAESLCTQFNRGWAPLRSMRRLADSFIQAPKPEYYDLRADPGELVNLYAQAPPASRELEAGLARRTANEDPHASIATRQPDADETRKLAELGYADTSAPQRKRGVLDPKDMIGTWAVLTNAEGLAERGEFEQALKMVDDVLRVDPDDPRAWESSYVVHWRRQATPQAEHSIRKVIELNPTAEAYVRLVQLLMQQGRSEDAAAALDAAEKLDPFLGQVELLRADLCLQAQRYDEARQHIERAMQIDPVRSAAGAKRGLDWLEANAAPKK
jgi:tetratricopeptide (TPR) repeat protein